MTHFGKPRACLLKRLDVCEMCLRGRPFAVRRLLATDIDYDTHFAVYAQRPPEKTFLRRKELQSDVQVVGPAVRSFRASVSPRPDGLLLPAIVDFEKLIPV